MQENEYDYDSRLTQKCVYNHTLLQSQQTFVSNIPQRLPQRQYIDIFLGKLHDKQDCICFVINGNSYFLFFNHDIIQITLICLANYLDLNISLTKSLYINHVALRCDLL